MSCYQGDFTTANTIYVLFNTYSSDDPAASITLTGLALADIQVYKNGSITQRSSTAGFVLLDTDGIDFDGTTGIHGFSVDLSDNTDAGFFAAGSEYQIVISTVTVDLASINFVAATFSIERTGGALALLKGTDSLANIKTDTAAILVDTAAMDPLVAKIPLSDGSITWNATALASVNAEADTAISDAALATAANLATAQADLDTITGAAGALLDTTATSTALVDDVWDEVLTGGTHNVTNSAGRRLRALQESSGYGGYIHVDTLNGAAGTTDFENGTEDNPVLTWADALTLNTSLGFNQFHIFNGSTITLTASSANFSIIGDNYTLALASQSIASAYIEGAVNLSGISSGAAPRIHKCKISGNTSLDTPWLSECRLGSTITLLATGGNFFQSCYATTGTVPIIDLQSAVGAQTVCLTPLTGGIQFNNSKAGDLIHLEGGGEWVLDATCTAGTFEVAGQWRETDNSSGMTISRDLIATEVSAVLVDTGTTLPGTLATIDTVVDGIQTDLDNGTDGLGAIKTDTAAILVDTDTTIPGTITTLQSDTDDIQTRLPGSLVGGRMDADMGAISTSTDAANKLEASAEVIIIGSATAVTLSTTQMSADGFTEATDDHFNGRVIIWTSGALLGQATDITDYTGASQTFTFTAVTEAPGDDNTFVIL